jgi:hypothetical protein
VAVDERAGRVAGLNRTRDGLVVIVDTGDAYRAVPAAAVERIETVPRRVYVGKAALAAAVVVVPSVRPGESPHVVRHIPRELDRLVVAGEGAPTRRSSLWYLGGGTLALIGGVGIVAGAFGAAEGVGGSLAWLWVAVPAAVLLAGATLLWLAFGRDSPRRLSAREKASDAVSALFGISPRTRRRG